MWYCNNEKCENHEVDIHIDEVALLSPYNTKEQMVNVTRCSKCNNPMTRRDREMEGKKVYVNRFDSLSDSEKKKIIKERATKHYDKFEKDIIERKKKQAEASIMHQILR